MRKYLTWLTTLALVIAPIALTAATTDDIEAALDQPLAQYKNEEPVSLRQVIESIGESYMIPIVLQPSVEGQVKLNVRNTTVRDLLTMLCRPGGYFWEIDGGYIYVRKTKTILYSVDYPQNTRSSQDQASVTLGGSGYGAGGGYGGNGNGVPTPMPSANGAPGSNGQSGMSSDATQVSVNSENKTDFWATLVTELNARRAGEWESVLVNKFAGLVEVDAGLATHARISTFLTRLNRRIGRQIRLKAQIVSIRLFDVSKLGVDWDVAYLHLNKYAHIGGQFTTAAGTTVNNMSLSTIESLSTLGDQTLPSAAFSGVIGSGDVRGLIEALKQQGTVRSTSAPQISALNNQTAYIKVAEERTFYQQTNTTQVYGSSVNLGASTPVVVGNTTPRSISIGSFLKVIAQVTDDPDPSRAVITLDVLPVLTRLNGQDVSPDGKSNAPILGVQQASTMVRIKSGESAIIGGFQTWSKANETHGIPVLGELPKIGRLFRTDATNEVLTELAIIITATVQEPGSSLPTDIDDVMRREMKTNPFMPPEYKPDAPRVSAAAPHHVSLPLPPPSNGKPAEIINVPE